MLVEALFAKLLAQNRFERTRVCRQCGLNTEASAEGCRHCGHLKGLELMQFLKKLEAARADINNLGEFFYLCSTLVLFIAMLILAS